MSTNTDGTVTDQDAQDGGQNDPAPTHTPPAAPAAPAVDAQDAGSDQLAALRSEAAQRRRQLRETETSRDEALARIQELESQLEGFTAQATRNEVAREFGIDPDVLRGSTKEELEAHAKALKPIFEKANGPHSPNMGYGHLWGDRLDEVAEAMSKQRRKALVAAA